MTENREVEKVRDGTPEKALSAEHAINEVAYSTSHDQTESHVLRPLLRFEPPEKVRHEKQRDERGDGENQRVFGTQTEDAGWITQMCQ